MKTKRNLWPARRARRSFRLSLWCSLLLLVVLALWPLAAKRLPSALSSVAAHKAVLPSLPGESAAKHFNKSGLPALLDHAPPLAQVLNPGGLRNLFSSFGG